MNGSSELSNRLRQRGNRLYKSATRIWLTTSMKKGRLENARGHYKSALECSTSPQEKSAANKNIAMASWKLASLGQREGELCITIQYLYTDALKSFQQALKSGNDARNDNHWSSNLGEKMHECLHDSLNFLKDVPILSEERDAFMRMTCKLAPSIEWKAEMNYRYAEYLFQKAIILLELKSYKDCKKILCNSYQPLEDAKRYGKDAKLCGKDGGDIITELTKLEEDVTVNISVVEARQALATADDLKQKILMTEEHLNIDLVWQVLDLYTNVLLLTREKDVELEAIAMSRMGVIYDSILKMRFQAKRHFAEAVNLAHTLHPRNVTKEEWYKISSEGLVFYQTVAEREAAWSEERGKILETLQPQVDKIKNNKTDEDLLRFIYKKHPPKESEHELSECSTEETKKKPLTKRYVNAILHYHPDHNSKDEFGKEWHVLCEEITKILNQRYQDIKLNEL